MDYKKAANHLLDYWEHKSDRLLDEIANGHPSNIPRLIGQSYQLNSCISDLKVFFEMLEVKQ